MKLANQIVEIQRIVKYSRPQPAEIKRCFSFDGVTMWNYQNIEYFVNNSAIVRNQHV